MALQPVSLTKAFQGSATRWIRLGIVLLACARANAPTLAMTEVEEFHAYILPETTLIAVDSLLVDSLLTVRFEVDSTAHQFNGYTVCIQFDPGVLAFVSAEPGSLMEEACGNYPFINIATTDSTVTYTHIIMCEGVSVDGPGELSRFTFQALAVGESPLDIISDPDRTFFDAGLYIWPGHLTYPRQVVLHDAVVIIYEPAVDIGPGHIGIPDRMPIRFVPNPARRIGRIDFFLRSQESAVVELLSVTGRTVWSWDGSGSGQMQVPWEGTDSNGAPVSSGTYFCRVRTKSRIGLGKIVVLQ